MNKQNYKEVSTIGRWGRMHGLYLYLNGFDMVQDDMTELMVEIVNVFDILERGRLRKNIVLAERQRIAADTVIIVPQQKILCFGFILDGKAA